MINFSTPSEQLVRELTSEESKAVYYLRKHYHGEKGYEKMRDGLLMKAYQSHKTEISDVVEYISPNGNRWMTFECCQYYKDANSTYATPIAFCYYETYGSVGAYLLTQSTYESDSKHKLVLHFTNHFFLRFCQRLGVEMRSRWMVQRFTEVISGYLIGHNGFDDKGREKIDVRLPASVGRGIRIPDSPIVEVRTYLTDKELSKKQLRETEHLRKVYEKTDFEPLEVKMGRIAHSEDFSGAVMKEIENVSDMSGVDKGRLVFAMNVRVFITLAIIDLGYVDEKDVRTFKYIGERTAEVDFLDFVDAHQKGDGHKAAELLFKGLCRFGELANIKGYNAKDMMNKVIEKWKESLN